MIDPNARTQLMLGKNLVYKDDITIYVPTINELVESDEKTLGENVAIFVTSIRELFSGLPDVVDQMEEQFPTFWDVAFDPQANLEFGAMFGTPFGVANLIIKGLSYWFRQPMDNFKVLSNEKIVNEDLDLIMDKEEYLHFCEVIKMITLHKTNEDLIAPKNMKKNQKAIWVNLYKGRLKQLQERKNTTLADKILILQMLSHSFIPFEEIGKMNYYQFNSLLNGYSIKEVNDREFAIYTSYKFDTSKMKLKTWQEEILNNKN